jgi:regulator of protease activity HflC (stomatin/prohibitin superfamily)
MFGLRRMLSEDECAVVVRRGKAPRLVRGPGSVQTFWRWRRVTVVRMRPFRVVVRLDGVLAEDEVPLRVSGQIAGQVIDPVAAAVNVVDYQDATRMIAETAIRALLKEQRSDDLVAAPSEFEVGLGGEIERAVRSWGLVVLSVTLDITAGA